MRGFAARARAVGAAATILTCAALVMAPGARAQDGVTDAADYAFIQKPGAQLPLDRMLQDSDGRLVRVGALTGGVPTILALGYFHCPNLCTVVRDDLFEALAHAGLRAPDDYRLLVVSIDPAESSADAAAALADDRERYPGLGGGAGWHFATGDAASVQAIEDAVGFRSRFDIHLRQFLHPAGIVVLTPDARVSGYVLGVGYQGGDVRTAVTLASAGGIAKAASPVLLLCFHFDAATGRYSLEIMKLLRLAATVTVLGIGGTVWLLRRRAARNHPAAS